MSGFDVLHWRHLKTESVRSMKSVDVEHWVNGNVIKCVNMLLYKQRRRKLLGRLDTHAAKSGRQSGEPATSSDNDEMICL